jgi:hypothetical protein
MGILRLTQGVLDLGITYLRTGYGLIIVALDKVALDKTRRRRLE